MPPLSENIKNIRLVLNTSIKPDSAAAGSVANNFKNTGTEHWPEPGPRTAGKLNIQD